MMVSNGKFGHGYLKSKIFFGGDCDKEISVSKYNPNVTFATFISKEIYSYAAYSLLVNGLFFQRMKFRTMLLSKETGHDLFSEDRCSAIS